MLCGYKADPMIIFYCIMGINSILKFCIFHNYISKITNKINVERIIFTYSLSMKWFSKNYTVPNLSNFSLCYSALPIPIIFKILDTQSTLVPYLFFKSFWAVIVWAILPPLEKLDVLINILLFYIKSLQLLLLTGSSLEPAVSTG